MIDTGIQSAYVKAIREAQKFIYIENQYFLGSSYNWYSFKDIGVNNLIMMEIPMWPEGVPSSKATQWILFWQFKIMQMMYGTIYKALEEAGLERQNNPQVLTQKNRRFMIYVHSKGIIVDDEYVLMGSANISQRPMEGTRDTEIAMGAYQPNHTWATKQSKPHVQVHGYRMSLWSEHIGSVEECCKQPESIECERNDYGQAMLLHGLTLGKMMDLESMWHTTTFFQWDPGGWCSLVHCWCQGSSLSK